MMHQQSMMVGDMIPVHSEIPGHVEEMNNVNVTYENNASYAYDDLFPALPHSQPPVQRSIQQATNKLRVGSSLHTQVVFISYPFFLSYAKSRIVPNYLPTRYTTV